MSEKQDGTENLGALHGSPFVQLGEEYFRFETFTQWVNKASSWFRGARLRDGYGYVCVDAKGRICQIGRHFMRARDDGSFPIVVYAVD